MRVRLFVALAILVAVVIFTVQNAEVVEVRFLFWTGSLSRALLLFFVFAAGLFGGWLIGEFAHSRREKQR